MKAVGNKKRCPRCGLWLPLASFHKKVRMPDGLEGYCIACYRIIGMEWYYKNRDKVRAREAIRRKTDREEAISHYGGRCYCCGEMTFEFLAIDHINGGGQLHRREIKRGDICGWLKMKGYPEGFRVLCHNCNASLAYYGYCPHQKEVSCEQSET